MPTIAQKQVIFDALDYKPTPEQLEVHRHPAKSKLVAGGDRGGKSKVSSNEFLSRFYEGRLYWLVAADYERTRPEFDYICAGFDKLGWDYHASKRVDPGEIIAAGGIRIATKSAQDPRKLAAEAPDGILACEASQLSHEDYLRMLGRLMEKNGWMIMSGSFESSLGWYPELFNRWQVSENPNEYKSFSLPTWSNTYIFPGGRTDPKILEMEREMSRERFMERLGATPCPPQGRVFTEFSNAVHTGSGGEYEFDPMCPVYLWIDPGYAHHYAVEVVQRRGEDVYIVDEVYEMGLTTPQVIDLCKKWKWWNKVDRGTIDIAGTQHQGMPAPVEIWLKEGGIGLTAKKVPINDGTECLKRHLKVNPVTGRPNIFINSKCRGLISELGGAPSPDTGQPAVYRWKMDREGNIIGDIPEDKNNDAVKATIYGLVDLVGYVPSLRSRISKVQLT